VKIEVFDFIAFLHRTPLTMTFGEVSRRNSFYKFIKNILKVSFQK